MPKLYTVMIREIKYSNFDNRKYEVEEIRPTFDIMQKAMITGIKVEKVNM